MNIVQLNVHSNFSLLRGASSVQELCRAARQMGYDTLALTDRNALYGLSAFLNACEDFGLRPIVGAELVKGGERAVALVRNADGYARLCEIISDIHLRETALRTLLENRDGLIILSDCLSVAPDYIELRATHRHHLSGRLVATGDVYFVDRRGHAIHRVLRAIDENTSLSRVKDVAPPDAYLRTPDEMRRLFPEDALENTRRIAEQCRTQWRFETVFPKFEGSELLERLVWEGARRRYGEITPEVRARIERELNIIAEKGFADYFLVVRDIVRRSPRTCGRGSAAASIVAYCLGITHVDPIRHNLFFERFLSPGRRDPPDIDVDFPWDERDDVLEYLFEKYRGRIAMVSNHLTFQPRAAIRQVAKVYGLPEGEISEVTEKLSWTYLETSLQEMIETHPLLKRARLTDPWPEIFRVADTILAFPRHLSVHCGGVVITPDPITRHVPIQQAAKGVPIIQWEKDGAEDLGLVKVDVLGNRSLAVIRDALEMVEKNYGVHVDDAAWNPVDDPRTQELIRTGDTVGVFYVESPAMRLLLKRAQRGDFDHLVILSSIIRPAAAAYIREYIRRLRGERYESVHPVLDRLLPETLGVMVYQEDVMKVSMEVAGFSVNEADTLRKVLSRKDKGRRLEDFKRRFFQGARERGYELPVVEKIWDMIMSFAGYSFCKAHSASYALVSFKSAWLRAHYPAEFMAAVISNQGGFYATFAYVSEARRMGLGVLGPDINESEIRYTARRGNIRCGLMQVKGVHEACLAAIVRERAAGGPFTSLADFMARTRVHPADAERLIKAGAFDSLCPNRAQLMWELALCARPQRELFEFDATAPRVSNWSREEILRAELETLGFLLSSHPLTLYRRELDRIRFVWARDLPAHVGKQVTTIGWWVTGKLVGTKRGEPMEFVSFEDTSALYETTFLPDAYARFCHMLHREQAYVLRGVVEEEHGAVTLTVHTVSLLRPMLKFRSSNMMLE